MIENNLSSRNYKLINNINKQSIQLQMLIKIVCLYNIHHLLSLEITCTTSFNKVTTLYCVSIQSILVKKLLFIINNGYMKLYVQNM